MNKWTSCKRPWPTEMFEKRENAKGIYFRSDCKTCNQEKRVTTKNQTPYSYLNKLFTQLKSSRRNSGIEWDIEIEYINSI